jgi:hypothetical protein
MYWVLPVSDPPYSTWGADFAEPLWYLRAYLWFVLLTPAALWMFRRWPKRMLALPVAFATLHGLGVISLYGASDRAGNIKMDLATYGACWLLGFAHHDGTLKRVRASLVVPVALALTGTGVWWALNHPDASAGVRVDAIPFAQTLYCLGWVLLLLRFYVSMEWLSKVPVLDYIVSAVNARAMTIYLWGNAAIAVALATTDHFWHYDASWSSPASQGAVVLLLVGLLLVVAVLAVGWVEDVAARRPASLLPVLRRSTASRARGRSIRQQSNPSRLAASRAHQRHTSDGELVSVAAAPTPDAPAARQLQPTGVTVVPATGSQLKPTFSETLPTAQLAAHGAGLSELACQAPSEATPVRRRRNVERTTVSR